MTKNIEKLEEEAKTLIQCECGCGIVELCHWKWEDYYDDITISYFPLGYYAYQKVWLQKLRAIWKIITGKHYSFFDVTVSKEEFENKMKEFLEKIKE